HQVRIAQFFLPDFNCCLASCSASARLGLWGWVLKPQSMQRKLSDHVPLKQGALLRCRRRHLLITLPPGDLASRATSARDRIFGIRNPRGLCQGGASVPALAPCHSRLCASAAPQSLVPCTNQTEFLL